MACSARTLILAPAPRFRMFSSTPIIFAKRSQTSFGRSSRSTEDHGPPRSANAAGPSSPRQSTQGPKRGAWASTKPRHVSNMGSEGRNFSPRPPRRSRSPIDHPLTHPTSIPPVHLSAPHGNSRHSVKDSPGGSSTGRMNTDSSTPSWTITPAEAPKPARAWRPTKKLTYQAMAGLRALHANDPKTFSKVALSERFGISYEAVNRILRSKYQDKKGGEVGESLQGTKWDLDARSSSTSPVPAVKRAFASRDPRTRS